VPIYEFICQSCGNEFEQLRSFSDNSVPKCSACASEQVVRRMGRPAIHFKGSGWYITDSKKSSKESAVGAASNGSDKSNSGEKQSESSAEPASVAKSVAKSESKTEAAKTSAE
jgi:putative FmdB family regulatory protein